MTTMLDTPDTLPEKASELIDVALADLIKCERSSKYKISMDSSWHWAYRNFCQVCFGGAIIAQSLGCSPKKTLMPGLFTTSLRRKLCALDFFRLGDVKAGMQMLLRVPQGELVWPRDRFITTHEENPGKFKRQMRQLARDFRALGL